MLGNSQANRQDNSNSKVSLGTTWGSNHAYKHKVRLATRLAKCKLLTCNLGRLLGNSQGTSTSKLSLCRTWNQHHRHHKASLANKCKHLSMANRDNKVCNLGRLLDNSQGNSTSKVNLGRAWGSNQTNTHQGNSNSKVSLCRTWCSNQTNKHHKPSLAYRCSKCHNPSMANSHHKVCSLGKLLGNSQGNSNSKVSLCRTWCSNQTNRHHKSSLAYRGSKCKNPSMANRDHKVCCLGRLLGNSQAKRLGNSNSKVSLGRT
jgi:hypothetical protein